MSHIYSIGCLPAHPRTDPASLACVLPDNHTNQANNIFRKDHVIANSDDAFIIKTNKKGGGIGRLIWGKTKDGNFF